MYTLSTPGDILRKDGAEIRQDDRFPEYQEYVAWLKAGNGPIIVSDPAPRPRIEVSAFQIRKALNAEGLQDAVESWVAASADRNIKNGYYHSPTFWSDHEFALAAGAALGKSEEWMYNFFMLAKTL